MADVLDVFLEERIRLHQLSYVVYRLGALGVIAVGDLLPLSPLILVDRSVLANPIDLLAQVGQDEERLFVGREQIPTPLHEVDGVALLVHGKVEGRPGTWPSDRR